MDLVKEAFSKVKEDIDLINKELFDLKEGFLEIRQRIVDLSGIIEDLNTKINKKEEAPSQTDKVLIPTYREKTPTNRQFFRPLKPQNRVFSTGNQGVPTDRQTDQQTDRHMDKSSYNQEKTLLLKQRGLQRASIEDAMDLLNSLDSLKKEIRLKFKKLTDQEILVFSTLYQLEEETGFADYKSLSKKLKLSESSIRDYIGKIIQKGIPIEKKRVNNKNIQLKISQNLKKIASLPTILQLREL